MVGQDAGEIVKDFSVAMKGSANKAIVDSTISVSYSARRVCDGARAGEGRRRLACGEDVDLMST